ncbi:MAG: ABC transporter ATP-binding protein, partial [Promethearchaeota archaeon]
MNAIEFKKVCYKYPGSENQVIKNISLKIPKNSLYLLCGPTGSGKTTLLMLARGFHKEWGGDFQGDIYISDKNIENMKIGDIGSRIGIIFQDPSSQMHQLRIIDEIMSGPMYQGLPLDECIKRAKNKLKNILSDDFSNRSPEEISNGEQQKVAIAASLAMNCDILLLDEPFSFLDGESTDNIMKLLLKLKKEGKTIIISTHNLERFTQYADKIVVLSEGKIILEGYPEEIFYNDQLERLISPTLLSKISRKLFNENILKKQILSWNQLFGLINLKSFVDEDLRVQERNFNEKKEVILKIHNVSFKYPNGKGIDKIQLEINKGEIFGIVGPNGCGKTTIAKVIMGLINPNKGNVFFDKRDISRIKTADRSRYIGYVTQNPEDMLFEQTIFKECAFGPKNLNLDDQKARVETALFHTGLLNYRERHPDSLSNGEKKLLTIASILANDPDLLILDEPESGLDLKTWRNIHKLIRGLKEKGKTIILITHFIEGTVFLCDRVAVMNDGKI